MKKSKFSVGDTGRLDPNEGSRQFKVVKTEKNHAILEVEGKQLVFGHSRAEHCEFDQ